MATANDLFRREGERALSALAQGSNDEAAFWAAIQDGLRRRDVSTVVRAVAHWGINEKLRGLTLEERMRPYWQLVDHVIEAVVQRRPVLRKPGGMDPWRAPSDAVNLLLRMRVELRRKYKGKKSPYQFEAKHLRKAWERGWVDIQTANIIDHMRELHAVNTPTQEGEQA